MTARRSPAEADYIAGEAVHLLRFGVPPEDVMRRLSIGAISLQYLLFRRGFDRLAEQYRPLVSAERVARRAEIRAERADPAQDAADDAAARDRKNDRQRTTYARRHTAA